MSHRSPDTDKINEILHFTHAIESFSKLFSDLTQHHHAWNALAGKKRLAPDAYHASTEIQNLLHWMRKYVILARFLDSRRYYVDELAELVQRLYLPQDIATAETFSESIRTFMSGVAFLDKELMAKAKRLACIECVRLDEALVCYENYAYHASVIMAASAVEARITGLIRRTNRRLYDKEFAKFTLGQLIAIFEPGHFTDRKYDKIKLLMPEKHRPLIALLNRYRVFSAHPKGEAITAQIADSMLHLAFAFMLDKTTCPYTESELRHK